VHFAEAKCTIHLALLDDERAKGSLKSRPFDRALVPLRMACAMQGLNIVGANYPLGDADGDQESEKGRGKGRAVLMLPPRARRAQHRGLDAHNARGPRAPAGHKLDKLAGLQPVLRDRLARAGAGDWRKEPDGQGRLHLLSTASFFFPLLRRKPLAGQHFFSFFSAFQRKHREKSDAPIAVLF